MKSATLLLLFLSSLAYAQYNYQPSAAFPFGQANPEAPAQIKDYEAMIGVCNCTSERRKPDGTWDEAVDMTWTWTYILNGMGVQDETLKADGTHSGSIRQFNTDSSKWYVHWYSSAAATPKLSVWEGEKKDEKIILYKEQAAPNGVEGYFRLTFYDVSKSGYKWIGEWVDKAEKIVYPTWKINCIREE